MTLTIDEILKLSQDLEKESKALKEEMLRICWFMRGGVTLTEAYMLDVQDREIISNIIKQNLETTKTSGLPFF